MTKQVTLRSSQPIEENLQVRAMSITHGGKGRPRIAHTVPSVKKLLGSCLKKFITLSTGTRKRAGQVDGKERKGGHEED